MKQSKCYRVIRDLLNWLDPYQQSFLYFKWDFVNVTLCLVAVVWLCFHIEPGFSATYAGVDDITSVLFLFDNVFVYLPNFLMHEMLGHNVAGKIGFLLCHTVCPNVGLWWLYVSGNGIETLVPLLLYLVVLRYRGGRYLLGPLLYWLGTTLYSAGVYAADARAMKSHLASADMISDAGPGTPGDWVSILKPLGLLDYDVIIGHILAYMGVVCVVLAAYSIYYYLTHMSDYPISGRWEQV